MIEPTRCARVQARVGILEDHLHLAAQGPKGAGAELRDVPALEDHVALGRLEQPDDRAAERGLPAAGLADEPKRLSLADGEGHIVDGMDRPDLAPEHALPDREVLLDVLDLDQGLAAVAALAHAASSVPASVGSRRRRLSSTDSQQRSTWPGSSTRFSSGGSSVHFAKACGQRGRNLQPAGALISDGGVPLIECSRCLLRPVEPRDGTEQAPGVRMLRVVEELARRARARPHGRRT